MQKFFILLLAFLFFLPLSVVKADEKSEEGQLFSTWDTMETDKLASAWLIKRFVDKEAEFKFFPIGELISEGIPFDTPDAELRRFRNMSTFEAIMKKYEVEDPYLKEISIIIHDIEVFSWQKNLKKERKKINRAIKKIIQTTKSEQECLEKSLIYFDDYYDSLKTAEEEKEKPEKDKVKEEKEKSES